MENFGTILEKFSRRLEDSLNIVNSLKARFEQSQTYAELLLHIRQLIRELHRLFSSLKKYYWITHMKKMISEDVLCQIQQGTMEDQKLRYQKK